MGDGETEKKAYLNAEWIFKFSNQYYFLKPLAAHQNKLLVKTILTFGRTRGGVDANTQEVLNRRFTLKG